MDKPRRQADSGQQQGKTLQPKGHGRQHRGGVFLRKKGHRAKNIEKYTLSFFTTRKTPPADLKGKYARIIGSIPKTHLRPYRKIKE